MPEYPGQIPAMVPNAETYKRLKDEQQATLAQHKAYAQQLEQKQGVLEKRQGDLNIADRLLKLLDSRLPKPARQFLSKELAQHVGVDPKSESAKGVTQMLTSLDPDSLGQLRSSFASQLDGAEPGKIQETVRAVLAGQADMNEFIGQAGLNFGGQQEQEQVAGAEGQDQLAGGETSIDKTSGKSDMLQTAPTGAAVAKPFSEQPGSIQSFEGQRTVPPGSQQASPSIVGALGLDATQRYRNNDLIQNGYRIPFDPKDQDKLAQEIVTRSTGLSGAVSESAQLVKLFEGRPQVLGPVGGAVQSLQSTVRQVEGVMQMIKPGAVNESNPLDSETQKLANKASAAIAKAHGLDNTAVDAARIQSSVLSLAYRMAIANDIPGNRLTNAIINQNLTMIGNSASPEQFKSVIADTLQKTTREFDETMRRQVGISGLDIMTKQLTDDDIKTMAGSADILPKDLAASMLNEAKRRQSGETGSKVAPASPTLQEEERTIGNLETQRKTREIERFEQTQDLELKREDRAVRAEKRADDREERVTRANEASATLARESFEYRKAQDIEEKNQRHQDKIGAAFRAFGNAIAGSRSGGGGGVSMPSNPAQDPNAFRITPAPQRTPPRPGGK